MTKQQPQALTIATRESPLALWQANFIRDQIMARNPNITINLLGMTTKGDQILDSPLAKVGGKGLFVKELETALLDGRADIAVHSAKDVPMELPEGLSIVTACPRAEPCDALVAPAGNTLNALADLPQGAKVGTSSLRRQCQLRRYRPDIQCLDLRGNVNTRLRKLDEGQYDAIILAAAGLQRLGFEARVSAIIEPKLMLPAVGQGVLMIEFRSEDTAAKALIEQLDDTETALRVAAERAMNVRLNGGCQVPIAGFATYKHDSASNGMQLTLEGRVGSVDGEKLLTVVDQVTLNAANDYSAAEALGVQVAEALLDQGAQALLDQAEVNAG